MKSGLASMQRFTVFARAYGKSYGSENQLSSSNNEVRLSTGGYK